jgi:hypothetical protein
VFRSLNGGASWSAANVGLHGFPGTGISIISAKDFSFVPTLTSTIFVATEAALFKSVDGGTTWRIAPGVPVYVNAIAMDPVMPTTMYAGYGREPLASGASSRPPMALRAGVQANKESATPL